MFRLRKFPSGKLCFLLAVTALASASCARHFHSGREAFERKDYDLAMVELQQAVKKNPENYEAHYLLGAIYHDRGDIGNAVNHFLLATQAKPPVVKYHARLGEAYIKRGLLKNAMNQLDLVLMLEPKNTTARNLLGFCQMKMGNNEEAYKSFELNLIIDPSNAVALANLAELAAGELNRPEEARKYYLRLKEVVPGTNLAEEADYYLEHGKLPQDVLNEKKAGAPATPAPTPAPEPKERIEGGVVISYGEDAVAEQTAESLPEYALVLPLETDEGAPLTGDALAEYTRTAVFNHLKWKVLREDDTAKALKAFTKQHEAGCRSLDCLRVLAAQSGARRILSGSIKAAGNLSLVTLEVFDRELDGVSQRISLPIKASQTPFEGIDLAVERLQ